MGLFAKAVAAKKTEVTKPKKNTTWIVGDGESQKVAQSVHELVILKAQAKTVEAKMGIYKQVVKTYAERNFLTAYVDLGVPPETPLLVQNGEGEKVTYVVQDRSSQYAVKEDQQEALRQLLGEDGADRLLYTEVSLGFNRTVMAVPGVAEAVEKALEKGLAKLVEAGTLSPELAELLVEAKVNTTFKPGTMDRLAEVCGRDQTRMKQFLEIAGSNSTRYILP